MINGLGVVGWGVGGIEAEAGMLGQPVYFLTPDVVGVHLTGRLREGVTATDLVLTVTEMLRKAKVVGKFVEFFGEGAASLVGARSRDASRNMAPEYGATMGFFPVDEKTVDYLRKTGRTRGRRSTRSRPTSRRRACSACRAAGDDRLLADARARPRHRRRQRRRPEASAGPHRAAEAEEHVRHAASPSRRRERLRQDRRARRIT